MTTPATPMFWQRQRKPARAGNLPFNFGGIDLLVMPPKLKGRLPALAGLQRQLVTRFGKTA
ncbi:hypothetical protein [Collinsella aerofaciens]|uniref:hypothetical protein n=1 Tax=Collinsella aerofaciens TaxID=74426 RepID=UPI00232C5839|nr:hypothetical protein [Collinsella aerofaciens]